MSDLDSRLEILEETVARIEWRVDQIIATQAAIESHDWQPELADEIVERVLGEQ